MRDSNLLPLRPDQLTKRIVVDPLGHAADVAADMIAETAVAEMRAAETEWRLRIGNVSADDEPTDEVQPRLYYCCCRGTIASSPSWRRRWARLQHNWERRLRALASSAWARTC